MEIIFVVLGVLALVAVVAFTHQSRKGQSTISPHPANEESAPRGAAGPSEVDRDRGEYPVHDRGSV